MKLFNCLDVDLSFQNFGSTWVGILRGNTEDIESAFLSLWNLRATGGELEWYDHSKQVAIFWTDKKSMRRYFFNRNWLQSLERSRQFLYTCLIYAHESLSTLQGCHEMFVKFDMGGEPDAYMVGVMKAERPDTDFKTAVLNHAFSDKRA